MVSPKRIFIIPYRNRKTEMKTFLEKMQYIIHDPETELYFSHQDDIRVFNRGAMKNIGFLVMKNKYPNDYQNITFVFHDIDNFPLTDDLIDYNTKIGSASHFYGFRHVLGGMFAIKGSDFEKTNGFPNFWGWGLEDNLMNNRCISAGIKIDRKQFFDIHDNRISHSSRGNKRIVSKNHSSHYMNTNDGLKTLKNIIYNIDGMMINITQFEGMYPLSDQDFYTKDLRGEPNKLNVYRGYNRKNWNMLKLMKSK